MSNNIEKENIVFKKNCGNCVYSSFEVFETDKITCEKDGSLQSFTAEKQCYAD